MQEITMVITLVIVAQYKSNGKRSQKIKKKKEMIEQNKLVVRGIGLLKFAFI